MIDIEKRIEAMGKAWLVVSICYGPMGETKVGWSVDVLQCSTCDSFDKPFAADSFEHAIYIAETEAKRRGWYIQNEISQ